MGFLPRKSKKIPKIPKKISKISPKNSQEFPIFQFFHCFCSPSPGPSLPLELEELQETEISFVSFSIEKSPEFREFGRGWIQDCPGNGAGSAPGKFPGFGRPQNPGIGQKRGKFLIFLRGWNILGWNSWNFPGFGKEFLEFSWIWDGISGIFLTIPRFPIPTGFPQICEIFGEQKTPKFPNFLLIP